MAAVDKFGAAFAIGFMAVMLVIMMGGLTPDGSFSGTSESETSMPTPTYSPPVQPAPPETVTTPPERESLTGFLQYTIRGGAVDSISNNPDANSVTVLLDNNVDGQLIITMTNDAITPFDDGTYFVTIDGEENHDFVQVGKRLTIDFLAGSEEITIFGISDNLVSKAAADAAAADAAAADAAAADAAAEKAAAEKAAADAAADAAAEKAAADAAAEKAAAEAAKASMSVEVVPVSGSASPGCEPECYDPSTVTISAGGTVTFVNSDTAPHTVTSGTATDGPDGVWDSSLIMMDMSYSVTLDSPGTYDYFCMVHPWMQGIVIVE